MTFWDGTHWVPDASAETSAAHRHRLVGAVVEATLLVGLTFGLIASTAVAAKPTSSVWVVELGDVAASDTGHDLKLGDHFTVGYQTKEREPWALTVCYPNATSEHLGTYADGSMWSAVFSLWSGAPTPQDFVLGESVYPLWTGGGADCTVTLLKYSPDLSRSSVLATVEFSVSS